MSRAKVYPHARTRSEALTSRVAAVAWIAIVAGGLGVLVGPGLGFFVAVVCIVAAVVLRHRQAEREAIRRMRMREAAWRHAGGHHDHVHVSTREPGA